MAWNATEIGVALGESINWLSAIIGIVGSMLAIISAYYLFCDRENTRKATLYFPLYLACRGIIKLTKNNDKILLSEACGRALLTSCAKTLDEIAYTHGSIIYLKGADDLNTFLSMKEAVDENLALVERLNWAALVGKFKRNELEEVESCATTLLSLCKEEVNDLKELPERKNG